MLTSYLELLNNSMVSVTITLNGQERQARAEATDWDFEEEGVGIAIDYKLSWPSGEGFSPEEYRQVSDEDDARILDSLYADAPTVKW